MYDLEAQPRLNPGRYDQLSSISDASSNSEALPRGCAVLLRHKTIAVAVLFLIFDCVSAVLSHFEESSWVYTLAICGLSSIVFTFSLVSYLRRICSPVAPQIGADTLVITELEVLFSLVQWGIALYNLLMVFGEDANFERIEYVAPIAFALYLVIYMIRIRNRGKTDLSSSSSSLLRRKNDDTVSPTSVIVSSNHPSDSESQGISVGSSPSANCAPLTPANNIELPRRPIDDLSRTPSNTYTEPVGVVGSTENTRPITGESSHSSLTQNMSKEERGCDVSGDAMTSTTSTSTADYYDPTKETAAAVIRRNIKSWAITAVFKEKKERIAFFLAQLDGISLESNESSFLTARILEMGINLSEPREWSKDVLPQIDPRHMISADHCDVIIDATTDMQDDSVPLTMIVRLPSPMTKRWVLIMKIHCNTCKEVMVDILNEATAGSVVIKLEEPGMLVASGNANLSALFDKLLHSGSGHKKQTDSSLDHHDKIC